MSLLLKSELRLRIGAHHCVAEIWRAGTARRCAAKAFVQDEAPNLVEAALLALEARGLPLPARTRLLIEDELLYFAALPATGSAKAAMVTAREHFSAALGELEVQVGMSLADSGKCWLTSALPTDLLEAWRLTLGERDIALVSVQPAVLHDWASLATRVPLQDGLVVMVRSEGLSFLMVRKAEVANLVWESRDLADLGALEARVRAQLASVPADPASAPGLLIVPLDENQATSLRAMTEPRGWRLSTPVLQHTD